MTVATAPPPPPANATARILKFLPIDDCRVSELNTRGDDVTADPTFAPFVESVRAVGILQPVLAQPVADNGDGKQYEIIAGKRRYSAALETGLTEIPALVQNGTLTNTESTCAMLLENLQRKAFDPIEEAHGYRYLVEAGFNPSNISAQIDYSHAHIRRRLNLLDLPPADQNAVRKKRLRLAAAEKRARAYQWLAERRAEQAAGNSRIDKIYSPTESAKFFDPATGGIAYSQPLIDLDECPSAGELARGADRKTTWREWLSGSEAGSSIVILCVISPAWRTCELAPAAAVKEFIRANLPGVLRTADTNLEHAEREVRQFEHVVFSLDAASTLEPIERRAAELPPESVRLAIICALDRHDLELFAARLGAMDIASLETGELDGSGPASGSLRRITYELCEAQPLPALLLSALLLLAARRDKSRLSEHPAAQPLLDAIGVDPSAITKSAVQTVSKSLQKRHQTTTQKK